MAIAIIPARGGSKRIPRKNIRPFAGLPAILRTINDVEKSAIFESIYVTTEDKEISEIVAKTSARIIRRSDELSGDLITTVEVIADAISQIRESKKSMSNEKVACIYPVTPLLNYQHVRKAINRLHSFDEGYIIAAMELECAIERAFTISSEGKVQFNSPQDVNKRTQDLPISYRDAGQFYVANQGTWEKKTHILTHVSECILMEKYECIDIDNEVDWEMAEFLFEKKHPSSNKS